MKVVPHGSEPLILVYHETQADRYAQALITAGLERVAVARDVATASAWLDMTEVMLAWNFPAELYQRMPNLRWVQWMGAGVDAVANRLPERVALTRIVGQFGKDMAEYVFTWLLHEYHEVDRFLDAKRTREWKPKRVATLAGKTLGVAGLGSIGKEVVRIGRAFGMNVIGLSRSGCQRDLVDEHFSPSAWLAFATKVDVLVVVLPLTQETEGVVDEAVLAALKQDAILINIGRGRTVDEAALLSRLQAGALRAAVLDVFEEEPLPQNHPFWSLPNVYITPHIAGPSRIRDVSRFFYDNYLRDLQGLALEGVVDRKRGY